VVQGRTQAYLEPEGVRLGKGRNRFTSGTEGGRLDKPALKREANIPKAKGPGKLILVGPDVVRVKQPRPIKGKVQVEGTPDPALRKGGNGAGKP